MAHLETATFGVEDGKAINVPTSGIGPGNVNPQLALEILQQRGWTPIVWDSQEEAIQRAKQASESWPHQHPETSSQGQKMSLQPLPDNRSKWPLMLSLAGTAAQLSGRKRLGLGLTTMGTLASIYETMNMKPTGSPDNAGIPAPPGQNGMPEFNLSNIFGAIMGRGR